MIEYFCFSYHIKLLKHEHIETLSGSGYFVNDYCICNNLFSADKKNDYQMKLVDIGYNETLEKIKFYLKQSGIEPKVVSIQKFNPNDMDNADYLFFGCWTSGLFFILQHPEKEWIAFAEKLPQNFTAKTALFTTYKIRTGSMFGAMKKHLKTKTREVSIQLQSRNGELSELNKELLRKFIEP